MAGSARDHGMKQGLAHFAEAFGLAYALLHDRGRAEDVCQEALLRLGRMGDLDLSRPIRELLLTIVRRLCLSELRRRRLPALDVQAAGDRVVDPGAGPLDDAERSERIAVLRDVLAGLDPVWRATLYLRDGLGLSYRQIAEVLDTSEDMVRTTLHRARNRARERLAARRLVEDRT